jgi:hypothetical protein
MPEIYSFPNNQDEYTGAEHIMRWHHGRTSGVFGASNNAAVAAGGGMNVTVSDGLGWLSNIEGNGIVWWNDSEATSGAKLTLAVDTADGALNRIDRVVVSWSTTNYVARPTIAILKGAISSAAVPPALTNNSTMRQISLARISVPAGATSITAAMITDERMDKSVCGIVTDTVSVDTSMVNAQVSELIEELRYSLGQVVSGGVPAHSFTHAKGGSDVLTPKMIGAADASVALTVPVGGWSNNTCTVTVDGITSDSHVIVTPHPDYYVVWAECMVRCTDHGEGTLTFACEDVPEGEIKANVLIVG